MTAYRQRLTLAERKAVEKAQLGLCACGCSDPLDSGPIEEEHSIPIWLDGDPKPDALMLVECHKIKTAREAGRRAKVKRITGQTRSQWTGTNRHKGRLGERCDSPNQAARHAVADASSVVNSPTKGKRRTRKSRVAPAMHRSPKRRWPSRKLSYRLFDGTPVRGGAR